MHEPEKSGSVVRDVVRLSIIVLVIAGLIYLLKQNKDSLLNPEYFREMIQRDYYLGVGAFVLFGSLLAGFGMPRLAISGVAGMLFGAVLGIALGIVASLCGATINFYWARLFMRGALTRRLPRKMRPWLEKFNQNGFRYMVYLRLFPLSNSTATNTLGGISRIPFLSFIGATLIGFIPLGIVSALFGSAASKQNYWQLSIGIGVLIIVIVAERLVRKYAKKDLDALEVEQQDDDAVDSPN